MANEILTAGIGDLTTAEALVGLVLLSLADREDFFGHPVVAAGYLGNRRGTGSLTAKLSEVGLGGVDLLGSATEGATVANTALSDNSYTCTVGEYSKAYERSDLAGLEVAPGVIDLQAFASDAVISIAQTLVKLIADLATGYSGVAGTSGSNMTYLDHLEAVTLLEIGLAKGQYLSVYHPRQIGDLRINAASVAGLFQYREDFNGILSAQNGQYKGRVAGVDVFSTAHVGTANSGADRAGCMVAPGAFVWADGSVDSEGDPNILTFGTRGALERVRDGKAGKTAYVTRSFLGVAEALDAAGVGVITDA